MPTKSYMYILPKSYITVYIVLKTQYKHTCKHNYSQLRYKAHAQIPLHSEAGTIGLRQNNFDSFMKTLESALKSILQKFTIINLLTLKME